MAEAKVVSCIKGRVFDVAVDLRKGSPTILQWHGVELSDSNCRSLIIPEGFAHGFQTLEPDCELLYFHTADYSPEYEDGIHVREPRLGIAWPEPISEISNRDDRLKFLQGDFEGLSV